MKLRAISALTDKITTWDPSKASSGEQFIYIDLGSVDQREKKITGVTLVHPSEAPSRARQLVKTGDVLVSTVRPNLNGVALVSKEMNGATASTGFCILRPTRELDSSYLFHWVRSPLFIAEMTRRATGQSYPAVSDRHVKDSLILAPDVQVQREIAQVLDNVDALRGKRRKTIALLDDLTQSIFLDMFGDPQENPHSWPTTTLSRVANPDDRINYGVVQPGDDYDGGVALIRVGDLMDGRVDRSIIKRIDPNIEARYSRSRLKGNEILVGCVGSIGSIALAAKVDVGSNIARAVARVPISSEVQRVYVAEHLRSASVQHYFTSELRTVAQPTLNIKQLSQTIIMVPPYDLQAEFVSLIASVHALRRGHLLHLVNLDALFASLQHHAFRGELWDAPAIQHSVPGCLHNLPAGKASP